MNFDIDATTIYLTRAGSHAYGTNLPTSDLDIRGIAVEPIDNQIGFLHHFEQAEIKSEGDDRVVFGLKKFVQLAADCNPNAVELLFTDESDILKMTYSGEFLRSVRDLFLTKKAYYTFSGYAHAQLKRIKTHRKWLLDPPKAPPNRADFGLSEDWKANASELGAFESLLESGESDALPKSVLTLFLRERQYKAAKTQYDQYQNWLKNRNPERAKLEEQSGYDTKHGMHLMRLLRCGGEILRGEGYKVKRPDAAELLEIRDGSMSYDQLIAESEWLDVENKALLATSPLPREPDRVRLNQIVVDITRTLDRR